MSEPLHLTLSRREHQVVDAVYALGEATAHEVVDYLGEEEAYDSVRVTMAQLEKEGVLVREREGRSFVYAPSIPREKARRSELRHLLQTFFDGSPSRAVLTFLDAAEEDLSSDDLERIARWIEERTEGEAGN